MVRNKEKRYGGVCRFRVSDYNKKIKNNISESEESVNTFTPKPLGMKIEKKYLKFSICEAELAESVNAPVLRTGWLPSLVGSSFYTGIPHSAHKFVYGIVEGTSEENAEEVIEKAEKFVQEIRTFVHKIRTKNKKDVDG